MSISSRVPMTSSCTSPRATPKICARSWWRTSTPTPTSRAPRRRLSSSTCGGPRPSDREEFPIPRVPGMLLSMFTVNDEAVGPHLPAAGAGLDERPDHERLVLEARDVAFDWAKLPFHYVPGEPFTTHMLNVLHLLLP